MTRDAVDALGAEQLRRVVEQMLRLHHRQALDRLVRVELELSAVRRERHGVVVAHHAERDEVHHLGNDRDSPCPA